MEQVINTEKRPIKLWLNDIEKGALQQAKNLANLPFGYKWVSIMPDSHRGYGMPIGGVLPTKGAIIPNAVGVDIGCGMSVLRTDLKDISESKLKQVMGIIRETVPVGFNHHDNPQKDDVLNLDNYEVGKMGWDSIALQQNEKAAYQLGTLGGGNHFIEIQKGSDGYIWIMIHSGSRNIGYTVAKHYTNLAKDLCNQWYSDVPDDLAFFPIGTKEFTNYLDEMNYCVEFALANRKLMMERVKSAFSSVFHVEFSNFINKPHNFAAWEHHYGDNVIVHRKGACRAREGEMGMIPSSQGSTSYLVEGKGNGESFHSCSHGAGRVMSRTKARKTLDLQAEQQRLEEKGILHAVRGEQDLDEAPSSYKNMDTVMKNQQDLVKIKLELEPLGVIKG